LRPTSSSSGRFFRKQALAIMSVAALVFAVLAVHSFFVRGKQIGTMTLQAADYAEEYVTPEFATTPKGGAVFRPIRGSG
jgi:hypothetical protein